MRTERREPGRRREPPGAPGAASRSQELTEAAGEETEHGFRRGERRTSPIPVARYTGADGAERADGADGAYGADGAGGTAWAALRVRWHRRAPSKRRGRDVGPCHRHGRTDPLLGQHRELLPLPTLPSSHVTEPLADTTANTCQSPFGSVDIPIDLTSTYPNRVFLFSSLGSLL